MSTHPRENIRAAVVTALKDNTDVGSKVYPSRVIPVAQDELPLILVYANSEAIEIYQESPREYERVLSLSVEMCADADENLDNELDALALQVEHRLMQDHTLGELCRDVVLKGCELTVSADGDTPIGSCVLTYEITYYTMAVADSIEPAVSDLKTIHAGWNQPDHAPGDLDAEDEIKFTT